MLTKLERNKASHRECFLTFSSFTFNLLCLFQFIPNSIADNVDFKCGGVVNNVCLSVCLFVCLF